MTPPSIESLMTQFLAGRAMAPQEISTEVVPYEILTSFRVDPRTAWAGAKAAVAYTAGVVVAKSFPVAMPTDWASFVVGAEAVALPLAIGHYPQMVRDLEKVQKAETGHHIRPESAGLTRWATEAQRKNQPEMQLLAAAMFRVLGQAEKALEILKTLEGLPAELIANERAAALFQMGQYPEALAIWTAHGQTGVAQFNIGVTRWVLGDTMAATNAFVQATRSLHEDSEWNHLAQLYLAALRNTAL